MVTINTDKYELALNDSLIKNSTTIFVTKSENVSGHSPILTMHMFQYCRVALENNPCQITYRYLVK